MEAFPSVVFCIVGFLVCSKCQDPSKLKPCDPNAKNTGPALPALPKQFFSRVEFTVVNASKTIYLEEYFDQIRNRAEIRAIGLFDQGKESRLIASYDTGELFDVEDGICVTTAISNDDTFVFAFNQTGGKDHVMSAQESLEFGKKFNEVYKGPTTVRNIPVNHWQACVMENSEKTTIDYFFAVPGQWTVPASSGAIPIRSIYTTEGQGGYIQYYEYVYFQDSLPPSNEPFLTPPMVYCPGRSNTKPLPKIPRHFTFRAESVMDYSPLVTSYDMWYDYDNQLTRLSGTPLPTGGRTYGSNPFTEVRDFKAGIRYTIDQIYGNCTVSPINADIMNSVDKGIVFLKNQSDFFHLDVANFTYVGQRKARDIETDVWIGQRQDYPEGSNLTSIWEWHFSKPGVYFNTGDSNKSHPVRFTVSVKGGNLGYQYNVIDFDDSPLDFSDFDITPCFEDSRIRRFQFDLETADQDEVPSFDLFPARDAIRTAVSLQKKISLLRIQEVQVDFKQKGIHTSFALMGLPTVTGDASFSGQPPVPLDAVASTLEESIEGKRFKVLLTTGGQEVTLTAVPGSLQELVRTEDGKLVPIVDKTTVIPAVTSHAHVPSAIAQCVVSPSSSPRRRRDASTPPLPSLPPEFFARIEFTISGENKTIYLEEYFNQTGNKAEIRALGLYDAGEETRYIASYDTKEFFTIQDDECYTSPLSSSDSFIFPFKIVNGKERVMSSTEALEFGKNENEVYMGRTTVRNIPVDHWRSCIRYPSADNETVTIDYYFTVNSLWTMGAGAVATPIKSVFHGQGRTTEGPYEYYQYYEYVYFEDYLPDDNEPFMTPPLMYCTGRKNTKPMPTLPTHFTFRAESVMDTISLVMAYDMWYDADSQLTRIDGTPLETADNQYGTDPFTEIRDFKSGIRYTIDQLLGNCSVTPLDVDLTDSRNSNGNVVLKNQKQLFNLDGGNFTYVGQRKARNILTDVWVGQRTDFPYGTNLTSTWEWHFSKPGIYFNTGDPRMTHPVGFAVNVGDVPLGYQYNIIDFDDSTIDSSAFDITPCFVDEEIQRFQLDLMTASGDAVPDFDLLPMKKGIRSAVMARAGVSALRVQEVEVDYDQKGVHVSFALLGTPTVSGDAPYSGQPDLPLDVVGYKLTTSIENGDFNVTLNTGGQAVVLKAVVGSLKQLIKTEDGKLVLIDDLSSTSPNPTDPGTSGPLGHSSPPSQGLSSGAIAGVTIAMTIVGSVIGACVTYALYRKRMVGYSIQMERFK
ncbi:uncharacterized protein LOC135468839 [Liolophura sinensis]|uniref:uncharacterized protein LOC135468839 n=1 Tax=Liolophura sinensis TaxID=3198878 RepID=UPI003158A37E